MCLGGFPGCERGSRFPSPRVELPAPHLLLVPEKSTGGFLNQLPATLLLPFVVTRPPCVQVHAVKSVLSLCSRVDLLPCNSSALVLFTSTTSVSLQIKGYILTLLLRLPSCPLCLFWISPPSGAPVTRYSPLT